MINLTNKKIALVGGAGFIGHNLAIKLASLGADVTIFDAFSVNNILNQIEKGANTNNDELYSYFLKERVALLVSSGVNVKIGDFSDRFVTAKHLDEGFDIVYLLAAVSHASRSNTNPVFAMSNSLLPLINVVNELAQRKSRLVFLSSSTVYGNFEKEVVTEKDRCNPFGMYAVMKYSCEMILKEMKEHTDFNYSVVRPSALYGERCISRRVSQIFLENSAAGINSSFLGNVDEKLDFTYIEDLVQGLILAGVEEKARGEVFNITFGEAQKVLSLVDILREYFPDATVKIEPRNQATPLRGTLSNEKARDLLGFNPKYSLSKGYPKYIQWYINFLKENNITLNTSQQVNE